MNNIQSRFLPAVVFSIMMFFCANAIAAGNNGLTLDQASAVVSAARKTAEKQGTLMNIAVVDAGANLTAFVRMDGAFLGSVDISIKKNKNSTLLQYAHRKIRRASATRSAVI